MTSPIHAIKSMLRPARRRINQLLGRDVRFGVQDVIHKIRLGTDYGGWVVHPEAIAADAIVYGFGVGTDISFDLGMIDRFGVTVHAFDPTPKAVAWLKTQQLPARFSFHGIGLADYDGTAKFTLPRPDFVSYHITEASSDPGGMVECPVQRLGTIMKSLGHNHIDVLKMDIEGAEYAAIADVLKSGIPIRQLLVEFHHVVGDVASLRRTRKAIESLNASGYRIFDVSPLGFEYSFMKSA